MAEEVAQHAPLGDSPASFEIRAFGARAGVASGFAATRKRPSCLSLMMIRGRPDASVWQQKSPGGGRGLTC
nr:MAG TPA: hypothetical protein [Caudoviricetes sp.]